MAPDTDDDEERPKGWGSGNLARDLGIPNPEAMKFKWRLANMLSLAMEEKSLDAAAVAEIAGEIEVGTVTRIIRGLVRDVETFEIMRLLMAIGYAIYVDIMPQEIEDKGYVVVSGPEGKGW